MEQSTNKPLRKMLNPQVKYKCKQYKNWEQNLDLSYMWYSRCNNQVSVLQILVRKRQTYLSSVILTLSICIFLCLVYHKIDEMIQAVKAKQVDGMLLDRYTASYYQSRNQLQSLHTVKKLEFQRDIGILFHENRRFLAECLLNYHRASIWSSVQTITATYKVKFQVIKPWSNGPASSRKWAQVELA